MSDRCTGHCCKGIPIYFEPTEGERVYGTPALLAEWAAHPECTDDTKLIATMMWPASFRVSDGIWFFTCEHFVDGNCSIYERRPGMCRRYPESGTCDFEECTWDAVRPGHPALPVVG